MFRNKHILFIILFLAGLSFSAEARFVDTTCISGNCGIDLSINDDDLSIDFGREKPLIRLQLNANNVNIDANFSRTFKILAYEQINNSNNVLSVSSVLFPRKKDLETKTSKQSKAKAFPWF